MRKRVISPAPKELTSPDPKWLDVEQLARVEVTSEDAAHPIEAAFVPGEEAGNEATSLSHREKRRPRTCRWDRRIERRCAGPGFPQKEGAGR